MAAEKARALVLRTTDWSESSKIVTLWTREFGKVRGLAKGSRRLRSPFDSALDLLTLCDIVLLRKTSGGLDLLTEAQVVERFSRLRGDLPALYAGYYIAELLAGWTEENDPHPLLFDEACAALATLGQSPQCTGPRLVRFELVLLRELGYRPVLECCAACGGPLTEERLSFGLALGGMLCPGCQPAQRERVALSPEAWRALQALGAEPDAWEKPLEPAVRGELRRLLNEYVTWLLGHRPRMLTYLGE
jgi:DNA repair protein RecO (recombination protein O)